MTAPVPAAAARPPDRSSAVNRRVVGGLLLVFGSGWMLKEAGVVDLPWSAVVSLVLVALGLALVITARTRARTVPLMILGAVLTAGLAVSSSNIHIRGGVGQRVARISVLSSNRSYNLGVGDLVVDLRHAVISNPNATIDAEVGVGHILVRVPEGVAVKVEADARFGSARVFRERLDVHGQAHDTYTDEGFDDAPQKVTLNLHVGVGQIDVERV
jgi:hypothetical protein